MHHELLQNGHTDRRFQKWPSPSRRFAGQVQYWALLSSQPNVLDELVDVAILAITKLGEAVYPICMKGSQ